MSAARLALLLSALCMSGCADRASDAVGRASGGSSTAGGGSAALASLPPAAGRVVAVRRTPYANGFMQEIVMEGPPAMTGENRVTVQMLTTAGGIGRYGGGDELKIGPPSDREVAAEMEARLPGAAMHLGGAGERNALGPFGYAVGMMGRLTCVYAWQYVTPARPLSLIEGASDTGALPLALRVRLCRDQPAAALVGYLRDLGLRRAAPDDAIEIVRPGSAGDALAAAVGSEPAPAVRPPEVVHVVARPAALDEPRRHGGSRPLARRDGRHARRPRRTFAQSPTRGRAVVSRGLGAPAMPRLPTPDDIRAPEPARTQPSTAPQPAPGASASAVDSLPMPR